MTVSGPYGDQTTDALLAAQGYIPAQQGEFLGRILDPVRAKALHEANRYIIVNGTEGEDPVAEVVAIAERFEAYLDPETE